MNQHDQQASDVNMAANMQPSSGRRRWVKGAMLATPAVLTLMSGRLAAANSMGCAGKLLLVVPSEFDGIKWVDDNGLELIWGDDPSSATTPPTRVLGYIDTITNQFVPAAVSNSNPPASASCLLSMTNI